MKKTLKHTYRTGDCYEIVQDLNYPCLLQVYKNGVLVRSTVFSDIAKSLTEEA